MGPWPKEGVRVKSFREVLHALLDGDVRFIVIGAMAGAFHGSPLRTGGVDLCPDNTEDNLQRLADVLNELGALEWDPRKGEISRHFDAEMLTPITCGSY